MNEVLDFEVESKKDKGGKTMAYLLGGAVYAGVIVTATVLTWLFVGDIVPEDQYLLRFLMMVGVSAIGLNAVALPVAIHFWAVDGFHRAAAIAFYALDMLVIAVNLMVSFSTLRGNPPAWVAAYTPYSVGMFVIALAAWGSLWILDPGHQAGLELRKSTQRFKVQAINQASSYLDSQEGRAKIAQAANNLIPALFDPSKIMKQPQPWDSPTYSAVEPNRLNSETSAIEELDPHDPLQ